MTTIIRNAWPDDLVPDAREDVDTYYSLKALDGATFVSSDDVTGAETYRLIDGRFATLYSIDLDWVEPREDKVLRTLPIGAFAEVKWVGLLPEQVDFEGTIDPVIFVIGDTEDDLEKASTIIQDRYEDTHNLDRYVVIELTHTEWDVAKRGQNINRGWFIPDTDDIEIINP